MRRDTSLQHGRDVSIVSRHFVAGEQTRLRAFVFKLHKAGRFVVTVTVACSLSVIRCRHVGVLRTVKHTVTHLERKRFLVFTFADLRPYAETI